MEKKENNYVQFSECLNLDFSTTCQEYPLCNKMEFEVGELKYKYTIINNEDEAKNSVIGYVFEG